MSAILKIFDSYSVGGNSIVLVGVNPELDKLENSEIASRVGRKIVLKLSDDRSFALDVLKIDIANSIINKKNIFIVIDPGAFSKDILNIKKGEVFTC